MLKKQLPKREDEICVLLHNIRSAQNVGSIFRTADAIGVKEIFLSGYSPSPLDKFLRPVSGIAKTALGAEKSIPWSVVPDVEKHIQSMKDHGYHVVGLEQDTRAIDFREFHVHQKTLFLVGNEVEGISESLRNQCDTLIEIPMKGMKESLNVSVAFGVALFRITDS